MTDDKTSRDKKPGEQPPGKYHYNPGNQSGKTADVEIKPESERDNSPERMRERHEHNEKR